MSKQPALVLLVGAIAVCPACASTPDVDEALRAELLARAERDQAVRQIDFENMSNQERMRAFTEATQVDSENTAWLEKLVDRVGWPTPALVGADGAHAAFLLVQHADHDPQFQARCLPLLRAAAEKGEGSLADLAYLTDRVRVKQDRPQLYGTQYDAVSGPSGTEYLPPLVEDLAGLDDRRRAAGLPPWIEYEKRMAELQGRAVFDAPRTVRTVSEPTRPPAPWPIAVANAPLEKSGRAGYLGSVLDLIDRESEARASDHIWPVYLDVLATRLAFVGEQARATKRGDAAYGRTRPAPDPAAVADLVDEHVPVPALETIIDMARDRQIVMVNEEHRSSMQRAFTNRLLAPLRETGFTHLAVETLSEDAARLRDRGYPTLDTGTYTRDPAFGDVIRRALELGYVVVGYEPAPAASAPRPDDASPADAMNRRERGQAENILDRILKPHPDARVLVVGGRDHIAESSGVWTPMGGILGTLTGIDPFTVNQMTMAEHSDPEYEHWAYAAVDGQGWLGDEPILLRREDGTFWSTDAAALDAHLFHPRTRYHQGRPEWMRMGGLRRSLRLDIERSLDEPVLLQAVRGGESGDAVPLDQAIWWPGEAAPALMLRPGPYVVFVIDRRGNTLHRTEVAVE